MGGRKSWNLGGIFMGGLGWGREGLGWGREACYYSCHTHYTHICMFVLMEKSLVALFCNGDVSKRNKRTH